MATALGPDEGAPEQSKADAAAAADPPTQYFPERIVGVWQPKRSRSCRRPAEERQFKIKWHYWGESDLTWETQQQLIDDGHGEMVRNFLLGHRPPLALPDALRAAPAAPAAAAAAAAAPEAEEWHTGGFEWHGRRTRTFYEMEGDCLVADGTVSAWKEESATVTALWRIEHDDGDVEELEAHEVREALRAFDEQRVPAGYGPAIVAVSAADVLQGLVAPLGSEEPNRHVREVNLPVHTSAAQRAEWEYTHVLNPETMQMVHKKAALAFEQRARADSTPGPGRERYVTGVRWAIVDSDCKEKTGYHYNECYETLVDAAGHPLEVSSATTLDCSVRVGYVRVLELRLQNGRHFQPRLGVSRKDASRALVLPPNTTYLNLSRHVVGTGGPFTSWSAVPCCPVLHFARTYKQSASDCEKNVVLRRPRTAPTGAGPRQRPAGRPVRPSNRLPRNWQASGLRCGLRLS